MKKKKSIRHRKNLQKNEYWKAIEKVISFLLLSAHNEVIEALEFRGVRAKTPHHFNAKTKAEDEGKAADGTNRIKVECWVSCREATYHGIRISHD